MLALLGCAHTPPQRVGGDGYQLAMTAFACWLDPTPSAPASCRAAAVGLWGDSDGAHVERLRTLEPTAVADLAVMVQALSPPLPSTQRRGLAALIDAVAAASHAPRRDDFADGLTRLPPPFTEDALSLRLLLTTLRSLAEPASESRHAQLDRLAAPLRACVGHVPSPLDPLLRRILQQADTELTRAATSANGPAP